MKEKEAKLAEHTEKIPELEETLTSSAAEIQVLNEEYDTCSKKVHGMRANVEETRSKQSAIKQVCNKVVSISVFLYSVLFSVQGNLLLKVQLFPF